MLNIKYDIVGSFLRTKEIQEAREAYRLQQITKEQLKQVEDQQIETLVRKEVEHGLQFVTDGEFRRRWWHLDWYKEFDGFDTKHVDKELNGEVHKYEIGYITGKFFYDVKKTHDEIDAFSYLKKQADQYPGITAKKCIAGPNIILLQNYIQLGIKEVPYYGTDIDALIDDIGLAYQAAIQDLYDHGCRYLQIDDTSWACMIDETYLKRVKELGYTKEEIFDWFCRVSTKALQNHPSDMKIANHFCKGNFKGKALFEGFYDSIAPIVTTIPYDGFFVEYDDERSGSFEPWRCLKNTDTTFVVGLISTKNPILETHDDIKKRYLEAKEIVGENLALSPQCGFASVEEGNGIDEKTQWKKIDRLVSCKDFL